MKLVKVNDIPRIEALLALLSCLSINLCIKVIATNPKITSNFNLIHDITADMYLNKKEEHNLRVICLLFGIAIAAKSQQNIQEIMTKLDAITNNTTFNTIESHHDQLLQGKQSVNKHQMMYRLLNNQEFTNTIVCRWYV